MAGRTSSLRVVCEELLSYSATSARSEFGDAASEIQTINPRWRAGADELGREQATSNWFRCPTRTQWERTLALFHTMTDMMTVIFRIDATEDLDPLSNT